MNPDTMLDAVLADPDCNPFIKSDTTGIAEGACELPEAGNARLPVAFDRAVQRAKALEGQPVPAGPEQLIGVRVPAQSTNAFTEREIPGEAVGLSNSSLAPARSSPRRRNIPRPELFPLEDTSGGPVTAEGIIAANRFGMGARPGELVTASAAPRDWLKGQLTYAAVQMPFEMPKSHECVRLRTEYLEDPGTQAVAQAAIAEMERHREKNRTSEIPHIDDLVEEDNYFSKILQTEIRIRDHMACVTRNPFAERLVRFWTNHFSVTANANTGTMVGDFERTVSRRYFLGKFSSLLIASTLHPAMLHFLNNVVSVGPNSPHGLNTGSPPANENLAREVLELHTMSSTGGYQQVDVEELANALTGCITGYPFHGPELAGHFIFEPALHEPGTRTILGHTYDEDNASPRQVIEVLRDIADHPATINNICRKLATHFVSETPPQALVDKLVSVWQQTGGVMAEVYKALIEDPLSWDPELEKFKTPNELLISTARAVGMAPVFGATEPDERLAAYRLYLLYLDLGQYPFFAPSPEGWSDEGEDWAQPSPMMARMQWADVVSGRLGVIKPSDFLDATVGPDISEDTAFWTNGAATPQQGLTLSMMSSEFQRR